MLLRLFFAVLWSSAGKWLTSWLLGVISNCIYVTFPCGILGQVWYLIASIPDLCHLSYFDSDLSVWPHENLLEKPAGCIKLYIVAVSFDETTRRIAGTLPYWSSSILTPRVRLVNKHGGPVAIFDSGSERKSDAQPDQKENILGLFLFIVVVVFILFVCVFFRGVVLLLLCVRACVRACVCVCVCFRFVLLEI